MGTSSESPFCPAVSTSCWTSADDSAPADSGFADGPAAGLLEHKFSCTVCMRERWRGDERGEDSSGIADGSIFVITTGIYIPLSFGVVSVVSTGSQQRHGTSSF